MPIMAEALRTTHGISLIVMYGWYIIRESFRVVVIFGIIGWHRKKKFRLSQDESQWAQNGLRVLLNNISLSLINGWEVVWAATAPYSTYLENGTMYGQFNVLSSIYDEVTNDFKGRGTVEPLSINYKK